MIIKQTIINNEHGIHLRPAGILSGEALKFSCKIYLKKKEKTFNVKSVLSLLGSCTKYGDEIEIVCDGEDEEEALKMVVDFLEKME